MRERSTGQAHHPGGETGSAANSGTQPQELIRDTRCNGTTFGLVSRVHDTRGTSFGILVPGDEPLVVAHGMTANVNRGFRPIGDVVVVAQIPIAVTVCDCARDGLARLRWWLIGIVAPHVSV